MPNQEQKNKKNRKKISIRKRIVAADVVPIQ
jgi:hypothetical protein